MEGNQKNLISSHICGGDSQSNEGIFGAENGKIVLNKAILSVDECRKMVPDLELKDISDGQLEVIINYLEALSMNIIKITLEKYVQTKQSKKE